MDENLVEIEKLPRGEIRGLVLKGLETLHLPNNHSHPTQLVWLNEAVAYAAAPRMVQLGANISPDLANPYRKYFLSNEGSCLVRDEVWDLILEGILKPGLPPGGLLGDNLPHFHLTERGKKLIEEGVVTPYDPDGYLRHLQESVGGIDPVIMTYMEECLRTYRMGCPLASAVTLGCASEKAFLLLVDALRGWLQAEAKTKFENNTKGRSIARVYNEFKDRFRSHVKSELPEKLRDHSEVTLEGIFTLIRTLRNDAGHPAGDATPDRVLCAAIQMFHLYVKTVYGLIDWLKAHPQGSDSAP